jgi:excisionase family DNA binding protein
MSQGSGVSIIPIQAELTTQEVADLLNVSRLFVIKLLESGEIPYHKVGTHRRIHFKDAIAYKQHIDCDDMYIMAGFLCLGLLANLSVKAVDHKYHYVPPAPAQ